MVNYNVVYLQEILLFVQLSHYVVFTVKQGVAARIYLNLISRRPWLMLFGYSCLLVIKLVWTTCEESKFSLEKK